MRLLFALVLLFAAAPARAHIGAVVSNALFSSPPPLASPTDAGTSAAGPYHFATADQSFEVSWTDGDNDPTGRFYFYYLDHQPNFQVTVDDIEARATPIPEGQGGIWAGCSCIPTPGLTCPDAGVRDCRNSFTWDTHALPAGAYYVVAANRDPPFHVYSVSDGPVRIAHGAGPLPPAVIVLRPDGFGAADDRYLTSFTVAGSAPFHFDLYYGRAAFARVFDPPILIAADAEVALEGDLGSFSWDVSTLPAGNYFFEVRIRDATELRASSDSRLGLVVSHDPMDGAADVVDFGPTTKLASGCGCQVGGLGRGPEGNGAFALLLPGLLLYWRFRSRAWQRGQKTVARPAWTIRSSLVPQRGQGSPSRP